MKQSIIIKCLLSLISAGLSLYFVITMKNLNILPNIYLYILIGIIILLNIITIIFIFSKKKWMKISGIIIFVILISFLSIGIYYSHNTLIFFNNSFNNHTVETTTYKVLVHNKSYNRITDLKNKSMGYFGDDIQVADCLKHITVKTNQKNYNNLINLYEDLINDKLDSIVLDNGYISILEEMFPDLITDTKVIYTFKLNKNIKKNYSITKELKPVNIYISGSDSRDEVISDKSRTDVNMILTINPDNKTILITSIPRDYYVSLYNTTGLKDKLTHSGIYGINTSVKTIENLLDIKIDYYVKVNFKSVISLVDLVGGIDIYSDASFKTNCGDGGAVVTYVKEGVNHFNGAQALSYARERYAYEDGDRHRIKNTQQVFKATFDKIMEDKSLLFKYEELLNSFGKLYLTNIPSNYVKLSVKKQISDMSSWNFTLTQLDGSGAKMETYSIPNYKTYVMIPYEDDIKKANENINKILNEGIIN